MGVIEAGLLAQIRPRLDRDLAIGFGRKHQDHFGGIDRGFDLRHALARPVLLHRAVELAQRFDFVIGVPARSEEHTSELQSLMRISYAVFCLKKKNTTTTN